MERRQSKKSENKSGIINTVRRAIRAGRRRRADQKLINTLSGLYPGQPAEESLDEYMAQKLRLVILVLAGGGILAAGIWQKEMMEQRRDPVWEQGAVRRGEPGEPERVVSLIAEVGDESIELEVPVAGKLLTKEEAGELEAVFWKEVEKRLPGSNSSLWEVHQSLELPEELSGYPFWVEWRSLNPELVSSLGNVVKGSEGAGRLCGTVHYEEFSWEHLVEYQVKKPDLSEEEARREEIFKLLEETEKASRYESLWKLPEYMGHDRVGWKRPAKHHGLTILLLTGVLACGIFWGMDEDLHKSWKECRQAMIKEYPMIVSKLALYLGAGMTIRGAMLRIADGKIKQKGEEKEAYGEREALGEKAGRKRMRRQRNKRPPDIYDAIRYACHEISLGIPEKDAYENLGRRTGTREYVRLAGILSQSLTRGGGSLLKRLEEEAQDSMKDSLEQRKKEGEEASTKLLLPMVMMLGIVMVLVIIPAFGSIE